LCVYFRAAGHAPAASSPEQICRAISQHRQGACCAREATRKDCKKAGRLQTSPVGNLIQLCPCVRLSSSAQPQLIQVCWSSAGV